MADRVMIFIDGSNLYHSLKNFFKRTDIDIGKFANKLLGKRQLIRERYYDQQKFFAGITATPYCELRLGRLVYANWPNSPPYEKGVDILLATDMITHSFKNNYDVAILVAGDNDYVSAIQAVKDNGKNLEVALFGKERTSMQLRKVADKVIDINKRLLNKCWK